MINNHPDLYPINLTWILTTFLLGVAFFVIKKLENLTDIKAIVIPTGDDKEDLERTKTAINFVNKNNLPKRCIIAGLGPDTTLL